MHTARDLRLAKTAGSQKVKTERPRMVAYGRSSDPMARTGWIFFEAQEAWVIEDKARKIEQKVEITVKRETKNKSHKDKAGPEK